MKKNRKTLTAADYYFWAEHSDEMEQDVVWLTTKKFFHKHCCLDDQERDKDGVLPPDYFNLMEACFEQGNGSGPTKSLDEIRKELTTLGMTEFNMIQAAEDEHGNEEYAESVQWMDMDESYTHGELSGEDLKAFRKACREGDVEEVRNIIDRQGRT